MHRWIASFLALVMLVPAFGPMALAGTGASTAMSCHRQPLVGTPQPAVPAMHCHGMASTSRPEATPDSVYADHSCCDNHDCCCRLKTSEWARPAANLLKFVHLLIEPAVPLLRRVESSADFAEIDSARAPPA